MGHTRYEPTDCERWRRAVWVDQSLSTRPQFISEWVRRRLTAVVNLPLLLWPACGRCRPGLLDQTVSSSEPMACGKAINSGGHRSGEHFVVLRAPVKLQGSMLGMLRSDQASELEITCGFGRARGAIGTGRGE